MLAQLLDGLLLRHVLVSLFILIAFAGLAWLFRIFLAKIVKNLIRQTKTDLDDVVVAALGKPLIAIIILAGIYLAQIALPLVPAIRSSILRGLSTVLILLAIYTVVALLDTVIKRYRKQITKQKKEVGLSSRLLGAFSIAMYIVAALLAIFAGLHIWGIKSAPVTGWIGEHGWRIALVTILSMVGVLALGELVPRLILRTLTRRAGEAEEEVTKRSQTLSGVLIGTGQVVILLIATFIILSEMKIDITPVLAGFGVVGIAVGFGAQSLVKDLVAGVFVILENQYCVGDVVKIADISGLVEDINLRRTVLRDLDGTVHVIPNGEIRVASNFTKVFARVNLNISVSYNTDLDKAMAVINRVGKEMAENAVWAPAILTPPRALRVDKLGDSGIEIKIMGDTKPTRQWEVTGELMLRLKKAFDQEGIEIPWPHTKIYFGNSPTSGQEQSLKK